MLRRFAIWLSLIFLRLALPIRYKIIVENLKQISSSKNKTGILFLANHSSLIDGLLLGMITWPKFKTMPLVLEDYYEHPAFNWFFKLTDSIPIPNFSYGSNEDKQIRLQRSVDVIARHLKEGKNVIVFPSGKIKKRPREELGGSSFLLLLFEQIIPENIVLVRINGLWGSSFSYAREGDPPHFAKGWGTKIQQVLANGIFFMPKRKVVVHFEEASDLPMDQGKIALNRYLTDWYNAPYPDGEPFTYYSYYFWKKESPSHPVRTIPREPDDLHHPILDEIALLLNVSPGEISKKTKLGMDLGLDSLDLAKVVAQLASRYDLDLPAVDDFYTINDIVMWIESSKKTENE